MGYLSRNFPVDMVKELHTPGPFSRRASTTIDYKETKRIATYAGPELTARDSTALFIDWDDALFPSTWVQMMQLRYKKAGQPFDLQSMRKMKEMQELSSEIKAFLLAASKVGHVFLVTAAAHGFVRKCCRIFFPELRKVLDDLQVTIIYARPQVDAEQEAGLKGSVGEGPNRTNYSDQSSVRILSKFKHLSWKIQNFRKVLNIF